MIGHKYTPTVGHTGSYAFGDHVRRNLGATVVELGIPPALAVGSVNPESVRSYLKSPKVINIRSFQNVKSGRCIPTEMIPSCAVKF